MALHLFRRHKVSCSHRSQSYRRCQCPIYVKGTLGGAYVRMALDQTSWDAASQIIADWTTAGTIGQVVDHSKSVSEAVDAYLLDCGTRELKPATVRKYRLLLQKRLVPWCADNGCSVLRTIDLDALTRFRNTWIGGKLSKQKNQERLRYFFLWCERRKWITENPTDELSAFKVDQVPTLPFTDEEYQRVLIEAGRCESTGTYRRQQADRLRTIVLLLRWTGLRIRDVATLERAAFDGQRIFLYTQKTGTKVYVPVPQSLITALSTITPLDDRYYFWSGKGNPESVTSNWQRALRRVFRKAGVPDGHPHRFRDTFAVELLLKGVELADVSILLGHSSIKVTQAHYSPWVASRQRRLEDIVARAWDTSLSA